MSRSPRLASFAPSGVPSARSASRASNRSAFAARTTSRTRTRPRPSTPIPRIREETSISISAMTPCKRVSALWDSTSAPSRAYRLTPSSSTTTRIAAEFENRGAPRSDSRRRAWGSPQARRAFSFLAIPSRRGRGLAKRRPSPGSSSACCVRKGGASKCSTVESAAATSPPCTTRSQSSRQPMSRTSCSTPWC